MRRFLTTLALTTVLLVLAGAPARGRTSCTRASPKPDVVFEGVAADGLTDPSTGHLLSPARFKVEEWIEGDGGSDVGGEVEVATAVELDGDLVRADSAGITPKAGERWLIKGTRGTGRVIATGICAGSERLAGAEPSADDAVEKPRPEPERTVIDEPASGGDDRALSLSVAAAGAVAMALALSRRWD